MRYVNISLTAWLLVAVFFRDKLTGAVDLPFKAFGLTSFVTWMSLAMLNYVIKRKYRRKITPATKC